MAQTNLLFTWEIESFNEIAEQPNLLRLQSEFEMRGHLLSGSLLIWEKFGVTGSWSLADFKNKKIYYIDKRNSPEMEVSEVSWNSTYLKSRFDDQPRGTNEGFIDWLKLFNLAESDLEDLKRTDLSGRKLDLEMGHASLLTAYELLREILAAPREWLIDLSGDDVQQIRKYLEGWYEIGNEIQNINQSTSREKHAEILQQIFQFSDKVKQHLGQVAVYLQSKKSEQLEAQVNAIVAEVVENFKQTTDELQKHREEAERNEAIREKEFAELKDKMQNELAKETVSKHKAIFAKQAEEHQQASQKWFIATGVLVVAFGVVFYSLFEAFRLGGTEWMGVLQSVFTKGFLLTLIYFVLNRFNKNYTAHKHLEIVNRHRQNALDTFDAFIESAGENPETRDAVLLAATNAIFDANQSGYLSTKTKGTDNVNPIQQVVRAVLPGSSSTKPEN